MKKDKQVENNEKKDKLHYWLEKIKSFLKKAARFCLNPHMLICFGLAWLITNGWCYIFMAVGGSFGINWMFGVGAAYAAFLWIPFTPEKIVTIIISLFLLRLLFPDDQKTLKVLRDELENLKSAFKRKKNEHKEKKEQKKNSENK